MATDPIYRNTSQQVSVANIKPFEHNSHSTIIPPNTISFNEIFPNVFVLPDKDKYYNIIESVRVNINTAGIYNIPALNIAIVNGVTTNFPPGFYNTSDITTMLNLTLPTHGPGSGHATTVVSLDLSKAPDLANITGFPVGVTGPGVTSLQIFDLMNGFDSFFIQSNVTNIGNPAGQVYMAKIILTDAQGNPDPNSTIPIYLNIPINVNNPNTVTWNLFKGNTISSSPVPWSAQTDVALFFHVYSYLKDNVPSKELKSIK